MGEFLMCGIFKQEILHSVYAKGAGRGEGVLGRFRGVEAIVCGRIGGARDYECGFVRFYYSFREYF